MASLEITGKGRVELCLCIKERKDKAGNFDTFIIMKKQSILWKNSLKFSE